MTDAPATLSFALSTWQAPARIVTAAGAAGTGRRARMTAMLESGEVFADAALLEGSRDERARERLLIAAAVALLLHGTVFALFFLELPGGKSPEIPPSIPVELVALPPPKPVPNAALPTPPTLIHRESGGDPKLRPGNAPDAPQAQRTETEPTAARAEPAPSAKAGKLPALGEGTALPVPPPEPPPREKAAAAATPAVARSAAPVRNRSEQRGEGGGDTYLNAVRDDIIANLIYPASARGRQLAGLAQYEMLVDRNGRLLRLRLVQSTGIATLDEAGMRAIELTAPFRPLPPDLPGSAVGMMLTLYIGP